MRRRQQARLEEGDDSMPANNSSGSSSPRTRKELYVVQQPGVKLLCIAEALIGILGSVMVTVVKELQLSNNVAAESRHACCDIHTASTMHATAKLVAQPATALTSHKAGQLAQVCRERTICIMVKHATRL